MSILTFSKTLVQCNHGHSAWSLRVLNLLNIRVSLSSNIHPCLKTYSNNKNIPHWWVVLTTCSQRLSPVLDCRTGRPHPVWAWSALLVCVSKPASVSTSHLWVRITLRHVCISYLPHWLVGRIQGWIFDIIYKYLISIKFLFYFYVDLWEAFVDKNLGLPFMQY